jgi:polysaccharide pyruvyl transferase WcaK-like protein
MGYFGYGNLGDEAILKYELIDLQQCFPLANFIIVSDGIIQGELRKFKQIPRRANAITQAGIDYLLWGGGWVLYDIANNKKAFIDEVRLLVKLKKAKPELSIILYSVTVGPIQDIELVRLAKKVRLYEVISFAIVRDTKSIRELKKLGFSNEQICLGSDYGYQVNPNFALKDITKNNYIIFSPSAYLKTYQNALISIMTFLKSQKDRIIIIPAQYTRTDSEDAVYAHELANTIGKGTICLAPIYSSPENIVAVLSKAKYVVTNRLHIAVLASVLGFQL